MSRRNPYTLQDENSLHLIRFDLFLTYIKTLLVIWSVGTYEQSKGTLKERNLQGYLFRVKFRGKFGRIKRLFTNT